jgi:hypothetical protein
MKRREVKRPYENPTIGLLLCKSAKKTVVELTLPKDANIHAKEYQLYLPSKEPLNQKLDEWSASEVREGLACQTNHSNRKLIHEDHRGRPQTRRQTCPP